MGQLADLASALVMIVAALALFGAAAAAFGVDSRPHVGDSHTTTRNGDWV